MKDEKFNLVPENLRRIGRRKLYQETPEHMSLKDRRSVRDEMKDKLLKAQTKEKKASAPEAQQPAE
ncbi:L-lysine 2,3-aminomutase [compost metagenome]